MRSLPVLTVSVLIAVPSLSLRAQQDAPIQLVEATIDQLHAAMQSGLLTAEGLCERYLARIAAYDQTGPFLNAFLAVNPNARAEARARDLAFLQTRTRGPLFGIPVLVKDNIDALPMATTAGSVALAGSVPPDDSFLVQKLRAAGAVVIGKGTLTEFANFMTTGGMPNGYSSLGGYGANPYDPRRNASGQNLVDTGGSSSGPGIAGAANLACVTIGTETSGSILSPSSNNCLVGVKPTVGLVSRDGILPITADQDTAGPMTRTVTDAAIVLGVIAGYDPNDPATAACLQAGNCFSDYTQFLDRQALQGARIAVVPSPFPLSVSQRAVMNAATATMRASGAFVVDPFQWRPPSLGNICVTYPPPPGQSTVLIFGMKRDLNSYLASLGPTAPRQNLAQIIAYNNANAGTALRYGQSILVAADMYDPTPNSPDHVRYLADRQTDVTNSRAALDTVFNGADGLPGTPDDFDAIVFPANFGANAPARAGYPSITVPGGFLGTTGISFGVTFTGRAFRENRLLALTYAFEQATGHRAPPASAPALPTDTIPLNLAGVRTLGFACAGSNGFPAIANAGPPIVANSTFAIALSSLRPNSPAFVGINVTAGISSLGSCVVQVRLPVLDFLIGASDANGDATLALPIPWNPALSGAHVYVQGGAFDPGANGVGVALSGALDIAIGG